MIEKCSGLKRLGELSNDIDGCLLLDKKLVVGTWLKPNGSLPIQGVPMSMVGVKENPLISIFRATVKLKELGFEVFVGRFIEGEKRTTMAGTQRYPTYAFTKLYLVEMGENTY